MPVLVVLLILLVLLLALCYGMYRFALYAPVGDQNDPHHVPRGEQYDAKREEMLRLIDELLALPA